MICLIGEIGKWCVLRYAWAFDFLLALTREKLLSGNMDYEPNPNIEYHTSSWHFNMNHGRVTDQIMTQLLNKT